MNITVRRLQIFWKNFENKSAWIICMYNLKERLRYFIWVKVFQDGPSEICGRQPLKNLKWYGLLRQTISLQIFWRLSFTNFTWSILEYFVPYAVVWRCSTEKLFWKTPVLESATLSKKGSRSSRLQMFFKISEISQESTCVGVSF